MHFMGIFQVVTGQVSGNTTVKLYLLIIKNSRLSLIHI